MRLSAIPGLALMFLPTQRWRINFTNPVNGRLWLRLLAGHPRHGLKFRPGLAVSKQELGFSFASNALGLRGPDNQRAGNVLLGTSFAMGLSVDNGDNWYEHLLDAGQWFNGAMPVGPHNQIDLLDDLHEGPADTLLYLYHPNLWKTAEGYLKATAEGRDIFAVMRWRCDWLGVLRLLPRWVAKECAKVAAGLTHYQRLGGRMFYFNAAYCQIDPDKGAPLFEAVQGDLDRLFARFSRVIVVRVPIKEEMAADAALSPQLVSLSAGYDRWWDKFRARVAPHVQTVALPRSAFGWGDFLPYDTHWSAEGNRRFARLLRPILREAGVSGVLDGDLHRGR